MIKEYKLIREFREESSIQASSLSEAKKIAQYSSPADVTEIISEEWEYEHEGHCGANRFGGGSCVCEDKNKCGES